MKILFIGAVAWLLTGLQHRPPEVSIEKISTNALDSAGLQLQVYAKLRIKDPIKLVDYDQGFLNCEHPGEIGCCSYVLLVEYFDKRTGGYLPMPCFADIDCIADLDGAFAPLSSFRNTTLSKKLSMAPSLQRGRKYRCRLKLFYQIDERIFNTVSAYFHFQT